MTSAPSRWIKPFNSLTIRMLLGFILVSLVAVGLVAMLANQVTGS